MADDSIQGQTKLQWFRTVMETVSVAAILWTASSIGSLNTQVAVVQSQMTQINSTLVDVPGMKEKLIENSLEINALKKDVDELRAVKGLK